MRIKPVRRLLAGLGVVGAVGALVAATASPALADDDAKLGVYLRDTTIAEKSEGRIEFPILSASKPVVLNGITVTYDLGDLPSTVSAKADDSGDCTTTGKIIRCSIDDPTNLDEWGAIGLAPLFITPKDTAKDGDTGTITVTFGSAGYATVSHRAKVRVGEGVDLSTGQTGDEAEWYESSATPGKAFTSPVNVVNAGTTTVQGLVVVFHAEHAVEAGQQYSNCTYEDNVLRSCRFDQELAPGAAYSAALPYRLRADTLAPGEVYGQHGLFTLAEFEDYEAYSRSRGYTFGKPGTGGTLTLAAARARASFQADTEPYNNWGYMMVTVTGKNPADLYAIGTAVTGKAGDVVTAKVGVGNNGPAALDAALPATYYTVSVPAGTSVTAAPENCYLLRPGDSAWDLAGKPSVPTYFCGSGPYLGVGQVETIDFKLRIDTVVPDATGQVRANARCDCDGRFDGDPNRTNDVAQLLVNPTDDGGSGGGGTLPITGSSTGVVVGVGVVLLAAGAAGFVLARRRRTRFVA
ncbi:LPXTG cell wall anchor domain-containing protein [Plantactinospora sp. GCM10030261]|uniref:LPXTG cell wall anchor domain-containing protein n=1 Tax=Plantactinospora sp. GCM10030261 TaxID=3273420 RepID=UPI00361EB509